MKMSKMATGRNLNVDLIPFGLKRQDRWIGLVSLYNALVVILFQKRHTYFPVSTLCFIPLMTL
jgi:hypothetical protein